MKKIILFISFFSGSGAWLSGQDTFSICAVDTITGEVGSAGASCIDASAIAGGVVIISDVHPGVGVIHTQSYWLSSNQNYAKSLMNVGLPPQQIIDSLVANDAQNNPGIRQYGIVDLFGTGARSAAFTGVNCLNYKNHILGYNYAIQGNILLGQQILDSMESRFLNTTGDLACKLMAAMQGAKVVGADTRCTTSGNSSLSSFLRTACPGGMILNLVVPQGPAGFEPIDSLQTLFDNVHNCSIPINCLSGISQAGNTEDFFVDVMPNPFSETTTLKITTKEKSNSMLEIFSGQGLPVMRENLKNKMEIVIEKKKLSSGIYFYKVTSDTGKMVSGKLVVL